jgi:shikimate kinase
MGGTGILNNSAGETMAELEKLGILGKSNIVLIGMPASGKSTVGVILAKMLGKDFLDTDLVIQQREHALLCEIIEQRGVDAFLKSEEKAALSVSPVNTVIATGGSVVYSEKAMQYLSGIATVIYLKADKDEITRRLRNIKERGVVLKDGENFDVMYDHRSVLYEKYADIEIEEDGSGIEGTIGKIILSCCKKRRQK